LTLPSCLISISSVSPDGVQSVPSARLMTSDHWPLAHRCHVSGMQFHCPSGEHAAPTGSLRRSSGLLCMSAVLNLILSAEAWTSRADSRTSAVSMRNGDCRFILFQTSESGIVRPAIV
jgi:hypothetical protein